MILQLGLLLLWLGAVNAAPAVAQQAAGTQAKLEAIQEIAKLDAQRQLARVQGCVQEARARITQGSFALAATTTAEQAQKELEAFDTEFKKREAEFKDQLARFNKLTPEQQHEVMRRWYSYVHQQANKLQVRLRNNFAPVDASAQPEHPIPQFATTEEANVQTAALIDTVHTDAFELAGLSVEDFSKRLIGSARATYTSPVARRAAVALCGFVTLAAAADMLATSPGLVEKDSLFRKLFGRRFKRLIGHLTPNKNQIEEFERLGRLEESRDRKEALAQERREELDRSLLQQYLSRPDAHLQFLAMLRTPEDLAHAFQEAMRDGRLATEISILAATQIDTTIALSELRQKLGPNSDQLRIASVGGQEVLYAPGLVSTPLLYSKRIYLLASAVSKIPGIGPLCALALGLVGIDEKMRRAIGQQVGTQVRNAKEWLMPAEQQEPVLAHEEVKKRVKSFCDSHHIELSDAYLDAIAQPLSLGFNEVMLSEHLNNTLTCCKDLGVKVTERLFAEQATMLQLGVKDGYISDAAARRFAGHVLANLLYPVGKDAEIAHLAASIYATEILAQQDTVTQRTLTACAMPVTVVKNEVIDGKHKEVSVEQDGIIVQTTASVDPEIQQSENRLLYLLQRMIARKHRDGDQVLSPSIADKRALEVESAKAKIFADCANLLGNPQTAFKDLDKAQQKNRLILDLIYTTIRTNGILLPPDFEKLKELIAINDLHVLADKIEKLRVAQPALNSVILRALQANQGAAGTPRA